MSEFTANNPEKEITLTSKDGEEFKVSLKVAKMSSLIWNMVSEDGEDDDEDNTVPLPNVEGADLARVIEYCKQYIVDPMTEFQKVFRAPPPCVCGLTLMSTIIALARCGFGCACTTLVRRFHRGNDKRDLVQTDAGGELFGH